MTVSLWILCTDAGRLILCNCKCYRKGLNPVSIRYKSRDHSASSSREETSSGERSLSYQLTDLNNVENQLIHCFIYTYNGLFQAS